MMAEVEKRLGIAASVVLPEHTADMIDEEMRRRRLPSRSAMIRAAIEDYFSPVDSDRCEVMLKECVDKIANLERYLESREELILALKESVNNSRAALNIMRGPIIEAAREHLLERAPEIVVPQEPKVKKWYRFWKREG